MPSQSEEPSRTTEPWAKAPTSQKRTPRARNAKDQGKSKEEREASKAKAEKDRNAKKCLVCLQTFMISSKDKLLYDHVVANGA